MEFRHRWSRWLLALLLGLSAAAWAQPRTVRVGVYPNEPKIFLNAEGRATGIFADLLDAIAAREGWQLRYQPCDGVACLDALEAGRIDLMPDVAYSAERARRFDFHQVPVMHSWSQLYRHPKVAIQSILDVEHFKTINDTLGHDVGDPLLREVATRVRMSVRVGDTVARLGGDEFIVLIEDLGERPEIAAAQAEGVGRKIMAALSQPYLIAGRELYSTPSVGVALFGHGDRPPDELLRQADLAMYQAKAAGRNSLRFFDPQRQTAVSARAVLQDDLRAAVQAQQSLLHIQPQVDQAGRVVGAEALLRWQHPARGFVPPAEFIPVAEDSGLIHDIGQWVLQAACEQLQAWSGQPVLQALSLSVNVSAQQFRHPDFVARVQETLLRHPAVAARLNLEITESLLMVDVEEVIAKMEALRAGGVRFSLDDFGTGYSSLSYLKRLPLEQIKIDASFVRDLLSDPNDAAIVRTFIALAASLGLQVVAEGVETEAQRRALAAEGCTVHQGYLYSRPVPPAEFERLAGQPLHAEAALG